MTVWQATLDAMWNCRVDRQEERRGKLIVSRIDDPTTVILDEEVSLLYGAQFGSDVEDLARWQEKCIAVVDAAST